jgi:hypothetical protein
MFALPDAQHGGQRSAGGNQPPAEGTEPDAAEPAYSGIASDILTAADDALLHAKEIERRLENLAAKRGTAGWQILTLARSGHLYDCVWTRLRNANPTGYFTPKQQALLNKLANTIQGLTAASGPMVPPAPYQPSYSGTTQIQAQASNIIQVVHDKWTETVAKYLSSVETRMVSSYVTADLLARRYALDGPDAHHARERLAVIAATLGDETMGKLVEDVVDPTDPEPDRAPRRHVRYTPGMFNP